MGAVARASQGAVIVLLGACATTKPEAEPAAGRTM